MVIDLALRESNYYRYPGSQLRHLQLRHVYLRYQGMPHYNSTFEIDDSAILKEGFTYSDAAYPWDLIAGNTVTLSATDPLCVKGYPCGREHRFTMGFGQCFGQNWIHVLCEELFLTNLDMYPVPYSILLSVRSYYGAMLDRAPVHAQSMKKAHFGAASCLVSPSINLDPADFLWKSSTMCGRYFRIVVSVMCQMNKQALMLM